jgi:hypothetical protein
MMQFARHWGRVAEFGAFVLTVAIIIVNQLLLNIAANLDDPPGVIKFLCHHYLLTLLLLVVSTIVVTRFEQRSTNNHCPGPTSPPHSDPNPHSHPSQQSFSSVISIWGIHLTGVA